MLGTPDLSPFGASISNESIRAWPGGCSSPTPLRITPIRAFSSACTKTTPLGEAPPFGGFRTRCSPAPLVGAGSPGSARGTNRCFAGLPEGSVADISAMKNTTALKHVKVTIVLLIFWCGSLRTGVHHFWTHQENGEHCSGKNQPNQKDGYSKGDKINHLREISHVRRGVFFINVAEQLQLLGQ